MEQNIDPESNVVLTIGPPGCGKTTALANSARKAVQRYQDHHALTIVSLTNTAAQEIASRGLPVVREQVGTLHAICYRQMDRPDLVTKHLRDWNETHQYYLMATPRIVRSPEEDEEFLPPPEKGEPLGRGDEMAERYDLLRHRMVPRELWPSDIKPFAEQWEAWKHENNLVDFTDMIERYYLDYDSAPFGSRLLMADESQDFSKLEFAVLMKMARHMDFTLICADEDQCHPAGTMIETSTGRVPIEQLTTAHRLLSADVGHSYQVYGKRNGGFSFSRGVRDYAGSMIRIRTAETDPLEVTPDHRMFARWAPEIRANPDKYVVYLMRQGPFFRIGWCKLLVPTAKDRTSVFFHLGTRTRLEHADAAWILAVFDSRQQASLYESEVATRYGLPLLMFTAHSEAELYTQDALDAFWNTLFQTLTPTLEQRADQCLREHGRFLQYPFWSQERANERRGGKWTLQIEACNLLPGLMTIPVYTDRNTLDCSASNTLNWQSFAMDMFSYTGPVYSLNVEPHHAYIAQKILVHNCLYDWRGANPDNLIDLRPRKITILEQSYRLPPSVHAYCQSWIQQVSRRIEKTYHPYRGRGEGAVKYLAADWRKPYELLDLSEQAEKAGKSLMILAACGYHLDPLMKHFRHAGIPYANPYRPGKPAWNPLSRPKKGTATVDRLLAFLGPQEDPSGRITWTWNELASWAPLVRVADVFKRTAKTRIKNERPPLPDDPVPLEYLLSLFEPDAVTPLLEGNIVWLLDHALQGHHARLEYFSRIEQHKGAQTLRVPPPTPHPGVPTIGTIHSVKGGEADWVYVFPDVSYSGYKALEGSAQEQDTVFRQFYVGVSRAKETLFLGGSGKKQAVRW